jgi:alpha-tubulin suppressor-like RCC1 family protein
VRAWGDNTFGQLGDGYAEPAAGRPVTPIGLRGIVQVAAGWRHSLACSGNNDTACRYGAMWAWGDNSSGQLGDGTKLTRTRPVAIFDVHGVVQLSGGFAHSAVLVLTLGSKRAVVTSGANYNGQLGDGTVTERLTFDLVPRLDEPRQIAAGDYHTVAATYIQPVVCCG